MHTSGPSLCDEVTPGRRDRGHGRAAEAEICRAIDDLLRAMNVSKSADSQTVSYAPPLLISATSTGDRATGLAWRVTQPWNRTTGHDHSLLTHDFRGEEGTVEAKPYPGAPDFGQNFHVVLRD
jgi:hypothetical protein